MAKKMMKKRHHSEMEHGYSRVPTKEGGYGRVGDGSTCIYETHTAPSRAEGMREMGMMGGRMINEDHSMPSNLPGHVIRRAYPMTGNMPAPHLNDSITGIDGQMDDDARNIARQFKTRKI